MQLFLWPDSPPKKTRAKLDTLIRRLRQVLDTHLDFPAPASAACYLKMQKGIIFLDNCIIDGEEFARLAREGLHHMQRENFWQAGNAFYRALQLWDSTAAHSDLFLGESGAYYDRLCGLLAKIGQRYTVILAESNSVEEAIEVVAKVLCITPMEDRLITLLYSLYLRAGKMLKAKELLQHYRQSLRDQEYSQDEIDELLFTIATAGTTTSAG
jgi:DNA-binding SARP family transcriptional activator